MSQDATEITLVRVQGLVLLKIIKHCHEVSFLDNNACGPLQGLAKGSVLEVTNCFPVPQYTDDEATELSNFYELEMLKNLRFINIDNFSIGFYTNSIGGSFLNRANLESLYQHIQSSPEAVMLVYDPSLTVHGQWGLKAYKLAPDVLRDMSESENKARITGNNKNQDYIWECDAAAAGRTSFTRLLQEIPIEIQNSHLANLMLYDIVDQTERMPKPMFSDFSIPHMSQETVLGSNADLNSVASMEHQLRLLLNGLDYHHDTQYNYQRKLASIGKSSTMETRNRDLPPIKLDLALVSAQMNSFCSALSQMAGETVGKLMLTQAIHASEQAPGNFKQNDQ